MFVRFAKTNSVGKRKKEASILILAFLITLSGILSPIHRVNAASCVLQGNTITVSCDFTAGTYYYNGIFRVNSGVTVTAGNATTPGQVVIIADDFEIVGNINANGLGSAGAAGTCPGASGAAASGGCHGGDGGRGKLSSTLFNGGTNAYGSATEPIALGSGGGDDGNGGGNEGGPGGGAIKLATWSATGTLGLGASGTVTANGGNGTSLEAGGGAGGSIWIDVGVLDVQNGSITANGGNGSGSGASGGGGGGGGRVALHYTSASGTATQVRQAYGGNRGTSALQAQVGGAGTIFAWDKDEYGGDLIIDNNNQQDTPYTRQVAGVDLLIQDFSITRNAQYLIGTGDDLTMASGATLTAYASARLQSSLWIQGTFNAPSEAMTISGLNIHQNGTIGVLKYLTFDNGLYGVEPSSSLFSAGRGNRLESLVLSGTGTTTYSATGTGMLFTDLFQAKSNATVTHATNSTATSHTLNISATSSIAVDSGALISLAGRGFVGVGCNSTGNGTGAGAFQSGGSHGGDGGAGGGTTSTTSTAYGSLTQPSTIGSSGGGVSGCGSGSGGGGAGAVRLSASSGTVTVNGTITANGSDGAGSNGGGGGAGGSVWIEASTVAGTGTINVRGGAGSGSSGTNGGGGGGGGRIAVTYVSGDPNSWTMQSNGGAFGGAGGSGGAGTVFLDDTDDASPNGTLILDNNSNTFSAGSTQTDTTRSFDFITIRKGAKYGVPNGKTLTLPTGGAVTSGSSGSRPAITVASGGSLNANTSSWAVEGFDLENSGTVTGPTSLNFRGGRLKLRGNGKFFAPVTSLDFQGDSGLDQESTDPNFDLTNLTIPAGSTFTRTSGTTPFGPNFQNLTIYGIYEDGSMLPLFVDTLTVQSGGLITHATNTNTSVQGQQLIISATSTISVLAGGSISVAGKGFQGNCVNTGNGPGASTTGGTGGSHGGNGGYSGTGATYGSATAPATIGSSGSGVNGFCSNGISGSGGGAIKLTAGGTVLVAGTVSAAGTSGTGYTGGASGGSIWIDAGTLTGGSAITASAGNGGGTGGQGGGAGGRIALYYDTDSGTGTRSAYGGSGTGYGGAGTIFLDDKDDASPNGTLVVNNNNVSGAATTQATVASQTYDSIDIRNAGNYTVPSGHTLMLSSGGTFTGGGSTRGTLTVNSGGTFNTGNAALTFNQVNVTNSGTISTVTNLTVEGSTTTLSGAGTFGATLTSLELRSSTFTQGSSSPGMSVTTLVMNSSTYNNNSSNPGLNLASMNLGRGSTFNNSSSAYYPLGASFTDLSVTGTYSEGTIRRLFVDDFVVQSGGLVMHATNTSLTTQDKALDISATSSISILAGGTLSAAGRGFLGDPGAGNGPGATGAGGMGPGHGGNGGSYGSAGGVSYGSATSPATIGSSGSELNGLNGSGGSGGGAIKLVTSGTLLAAGTLSAAATNGTGYGAGGAGGSIWLDADTLTGGSAITTNGGNTGGSPSAGGAGGRIALYYNTDSSTGTRTAYGGTGSFGGEQGGAGTIFLDDKNDALANGTLLVNNNNASGAATTQVSGLSQTYDVVDVRSAANYVVPSGYTLAIPSGGDLTGSGSTKGTLTVNSGGTLNAGAATRNVSGLNITNAGTIGTVTTLTYGNGTFTNTGSFSAGLHSLTVGAGGNFVHATTSQLFTGSDLTVESGATFTQSSSTTQNITTVLVKTGGTLTSSDNSTTHAYGVNISSTTFTVQPGGLVTTDTKGFDSTTGNGQGGDGTAGGGGGHGGVGGIGRVASINRGTGGPTYSATTTPNIIGSGGGDDTDVASQQGGSGGGSVILTVTGVFTMNGDISADGQAGTANEGGGGSGGSVWLTLGSWTGSGTSTITATGGTGNGTDATGGGCGAGGRVYVTYAGKTYTGTAPSVAAGTGCTGFRAGQAGSFLEEQTGAAPVNTGTVINPTVPEVGQNIVASATATDDDGVSKIELYLDGTAPGNLVRTCLFNPIQTPAACQYQAGSLTAGSHSVTTVSYDQYDLTDSDTTNFTVAGHTAANRMELSTYKKGATSTFSLSFTLSATSTGTLTVTFPSQFTVNSAATSGSACFSSFGFSATTLTATKTNCTGTVSITGASLTNPSVAGTYTVTFTNDNGSGVITIVDDDNFSISASIDPIITFNVGAQAAATACDGTFTGSGGTIGLGSLTVFAVGSSDLSSVPHICTRLSTNAPGGAVVTVLSQNASLASTASPGDAIPSGSVTLAAGTAGYGMCAGDGGSDTGKDSTTPVGASPVRTGPFGGSCSTSGHQVGGLTTSAQIVWSVNDPTQNAFARLFVKAAISSSILPHNDYADVLTFIATATY